MSDIYEIDEFFEPDELDDMELSIVDEEKAPSEAPSDPTKRELPEWLQKRIAERNEVSAHADELLDNAFSDPNALTRYITAQARMGNMGVTNALLVSEKMPEARLLNTFEEWADKGRNVRRGAKAIKLIVPVGAHSSDRSGDKSPTYGVKNFFDVSQTHGLSDDLLDEYAFDSTEDRLKTLLENKRFPVKEDSELHADIGAEFDPEQGIIRVYPYQSRQHMLYSLTRECVRAFYNDADPFFCEVSARIVCARCRETIEPLTELPSGLSDMTSEEKRKLLNSIRKVSYGVFTRAAESMSKEEWVAEKRAEMESFSRMTASMGDAVFSDPVKYDEYLSLLARLGSKITPDNVLAVMSQMPEATHIDDAGAWKKAGRSIAKDAVGIEVLRKTGEYTRDDGSVGLNFGVRTVYDISQTTGSPIETDAKADVSINTLGNAILEGTALPVLAHDGVDPETGALTMEHKGETAVFVSPKASPDRATFGIMRELSLHALRSTKTPFREFVADTCAAILCKHYGLTAPLLVLPDGISDTDHRKRMEIVHAARLQAAQHIKRTDKNLATAERREQAAKQRRRDER